MLGYAVILIAMLILRYIERQYYKKNKWTNSRNPRRKKLIAVREKKEKFAVFNFKPDPILRKRFKVNVFYIKKEFYQKLRYILSMFL